MFRRSTAAAAAGGAWPGEGCEGPICIEGPLELRFDPTAQEHYLQYKGSAFWRDAFGKRDDTFARYMFNFMSAFVLSMRPADSSGLPLAAIRAEKAIIGAVDLSGCKDSIRTATTPFARRWQVAPLLETDTGRMACFLDLRHALPIECVRNDDTLAVSGSIGAESEWGVPSEAPLPQGPVDLEPGIVLCRSMSGMFVIVSADRDRVQETFYGTLVVPPGSCDWQLVRSTRFKCT